MSDGNVFSLYVFWWWHLEWISDFVFNKFLFGSSGISSLLGVSDSVLKVSCRARIFFLSSKIVVTSFGGLFSNFQSSADRYHFCTMLH